MLLTYHNKRYHNIFFLTPTLVNILVVPVMSLPDREMDVHVYGNSTNHWSKQTWRKFISQWNSSCFRISPSSLSCASSASATALTALTTLSTVKWSPPRFILCSMFDSGSYGTYSVWQCWIIWSISSLLFFFSRRPSCTWFKHMRRFHVHL